MTEEEKETISILEDLAEHGLCYTVTEDIQGKLKIILNLIQRKDRQIDLMAFSLADYVMYYEYDKCRNPEMIKSKAEEIKKYFEKQAKDVEK